MSVLTLDLRLKATRFIDWSHTTHKLEKAHKRHYRINWYCKAGSCGNASYITGFYGNIKREVRAVKIKR
jgi:hypothetical protein